MKAKFTDWSALKAVRPAEEEPVAPAAPPPAKEEIPSLLGEMMGAKKSSGASLEKPAAEPAPDREAELEEALRQLAVENVKLAQERDELAARLEEERKAAEALRAGRDDSAARVAAAKQECAKFQRAAAEREEELVSRIRRLEEELEAEKMRGGSVMALIDRPDEFREAFPGELREHVTTALAEQLNLAAHSARTRHERAIEAVLGANPPSGEFERRRAEIGRILKDAGRFVDDRAISELRKLGFSYITGSNHHKLDYMGERFAIAKTPSDHRSLVNTALEIANRIF